MCKGDIEFTLKTLPHPTFSRSGDDLIYTAKVSLVDALSGCSVRVKVSWLVN